MQDPYYQDFCDENEFQWHIPCNPTEIRRIIYTTKIIEGYHRQIRKLTKIKGTFASENTLLKIIYLASIRIMEESKTSVWNWNITLQKFVIIFGDRIKLALN